MPESKMWQFLHQMGVGCWVEGLGVTDLRSGLVKMLHRPEG
jgi:hypothetical protein